MITIKIVLKSAEFEQQTKTSYLYKVQSDSKINVRVIKCIRLRVIIRVIKNLDIINV